MMDEARALAVARGSVALEGGRQSAKARELALLVGDGSISIDQAIQRLRAHHTQPATIDTHGAERSDRIPAGRTEPAAGEG